MSEPAQRETVVVIDDDYAMRLSCRKILAKSGFQVETFEDGAAGLEGVARLKPALVVVDLKMPGLSGIEVIGRVHQIDPEIVVVVITGYATIDTAIEAMKSGAYDFLPKPFSPEELRLIVNRGLERRRLLLESQRFELERAMLKRRFITLVSHQLQTPLVAVHQYLDVLTRLEDSAEAAGKRREWMQRCLKRTEEMQAMIKDWLTLARVESESLARRREKLDLQPVLAGILTTYEPQAACEGLVIECRLPNGELLVSGDRSCLTVLFDNLIANAIKYNRSGGKVTVTAGQDGGEVIVAVADTGIGISEKDRPFIFDEFFRAKGEAAKRTTGTGLGLPICKRIITEMGGSISVVSVVNVGSTFQVRLPEWRPTPEGPAAGLPGPVEEETALEPIAQNHPDRR